MGSSYSEVLERRIEHLELNSKRLEQENKELKERNKRNEVVIYYHQLLMSQRGV